MANATSHAGQDLIVEDNSDDDEYDQDEFVDQPNVPVDPLIAAKVT